MQCMEMKTPQGAVEENIGGIPLRESIFDEKNLNFCGKRPGKW